MNAEKRDMRKPRLLKWIASIAGITVIVACMIAIHFPPGEAMADAATSTQAAAQSSTTHPTVGVQDSWVSATCWGGPQDGQVPAVDSHYWAGLHASTVRFSPTWDIAYPLPPGPDATAVGIEQTCFRTWLSRLAAKGVSAEIAFKPDYCFGNSAGCPDTQTGNVVIPTLAEYQAAIKDFLASFPQVNIIAPWGEPDFQPGTPKPTKKDKHPKAEPPFTIGGAPGTNFGSVKCPKKGASVANCGPMLAAAMWVTVETQCFTCTVIAGDFGGAGRHDYSYLKPYNHYLSSRGYRPTVWGIHPYGDVKHQECELARAAGSTAPCNRKPLPNCGAHTLVACFSGWLHADKYGPQTQIWLDEVSSFSTGQWSGQVQAGGVRYLLQDLPHVTAAGDPSVTRIYYLRFAGPTNDALVVPVKREGKWIWKAEPAYHAMASILASWSPKPQLTAAPAPAAPVSAASAPAAAPESPAATTAYEIRNAAGNLCLDANDAGPTAGQNGDEVRLWNCYGAANQKWIPEYKSGQLAWLVNAEYPNMCLNADDTGGLVNGRRVQLWNCYNSANELWNAGTLLANPLGAPLLLGAGSQSLALDADKYHLGNGDTVQVWAYYGADNQTWYPDPA